MVAPIDPYTRIYADIRKDVPSVVEATFKQELFRVVDDFCQYTNIWQQQIPVNVVPDVDTYDVSAAPNTGRTNRLLFVYDANAQSKHWPMSGIQMRVPGVMTLARMPSQAATWTAIIAVRPVDPVNSVSGYPVAEDWFIDKYADTIGRGVLARLQLEPQKPYSNPMLATVNQRAYIAGRALARVNDLFTNVYGAQAWRFPQGWATVQKKGFT